MTVPPIDLKAIMLAAQVAKVLNVIHRVAYALVSPELQVLYASPNFNTVVSKPTHNILGQPLCDLMWEFVGVEESLIAIINGNMPFLAFERVTREMKDERLLYLDIHVTPVDIPELASGLLLIVEDVTEQAQMEQRLTQHRNELLLVKEQLSEANKELYHLNQFKSLFLSLAVHDLRTPLTSIMAYSDLVLRMLPEDASPKIKEYTEIIQKQSMRMEWLINDFLDLDSLDQGRLVLRPQMQELNDVVEQVANLLKYQAVKRNLKMSLHLWPEEICFAFDENRLQQILYNLINNAIKYTPEGGNIVLSTRVEGETAVFQVTDSGQGMNEEQQAAAFNLYYRTEDADKYDISGRGLGLYIVRMLTEAHGGHVDLTSKVNQGSTFRVYLPMKSAL
ncbi:MAG: hypothetical protein CSA11_03575 [Chloroflexi bacterium]|nr:MAG: hypothetical protein CSA11_03575 [Chloroflexota bacterium]